MKKWITAVSAATLFCSLMSGTVFAFSDVDGDQKEPIMALKDRGIVSGIDGQRYVPMGKVSYGQSINLIVKGLGLNIDNIKFVKKPLASDYFTNIPDDAWYAQAFIIAHLNGLPIPKDIDANGTITREQFADLLIHAIDTKGSFPVVKMLVLLADQDQIDQQAGYSVQRVILHNIMKLGEDRKFYPKQEMSRGEAAVWVFNAIRFIESHQQKPDPQEQVTVTVEKVNDEVNKVILSRGQKPTAGYDIAITGIRFEQEGRAVISYMVTDPKLDSMNAQVVTEPKAETYVSSKYKPVAEPRPSEQK
ncbi:S-layer homology domain-containing protein [Paenibacillus cremeus]|uniref:Protease complex subunit PrcB family protein n=1 Tax=Paenibacillus cremeus TaxID=2163881 RepID=A0A559JPU6_9BACL|nr:S-layer homology domain-containing protein [Paenibacillus cremeus]TVY01899.1 protease complex subunit PrcB family protein [Paenibacillus cremeus]